MSTQDVFYTIGKQHEVCQDYAAQLPGVLVVADGCSGSQDSDIGARLLSRAALALATELDGLDYHACGQKVLTLARQAAAPLALPPTALDATLMLAWQVEDQIRVRMYGDGCVIFKHKGGKTGVIQVEFARNAPYYLSYWDNPLRRALYLKKHQEQPTPLRLTDSRTPELQRYPIDYVLEFSFTNDEYPLLGIASDGLGLLVDAGSRKILPVPEVVAQLLDFDALPKRFLVQHMRKLLLRYGQEGVYALDDLSLAIFAR